MAKSKEDAALSRTEEPLNEKQIAKAVENLPSKMREYYDEMVKIALGLNTAEIMARYDLGELVINIQADESLLAEHKDNSNPVEYLAELAGMSSQMLYDCKNVCQTWSRAEVTGFITKNEDGNRLGWSHLNAIKRISSQKRRDRLIARVFKEGLSSRDVLALIAAEEETTKAKSHKKGRPLSKPKSLNSGLKQAAAVAGKFSRLSEEVWNSVIFDELDAISNTQVTDSLLELFGQTKDAMEKAHAESAKDLNRMRSIEARLNKFAKARASGATEDDERPARAAKSSKSAKSSKQPVAGKKKKKKKKRVAAEA